VQEGNYNVPQVSCMIYWSDNKATVYVVNSFFTSNWMCVYKMESCVPYSNLLHIF
jgi:hypothetical protein